MEGFWDLNVIPFVTAIGGIIVGGITSYVAMRKDRRETRDQVMEEANTTIDLLKEQNSILRDQVSAGEARERAYQDREKRLEMRVQELERDYRQLLTSITSMGLCTKAATCPEYDPATGHTFQIAKRTK